MNRTFPGNYFMLKKFSLLYDYYAYIDVPEYYADQLFVRHKVSVHFGNEYAHTNEPYVIIFCKVRKKDSHSFLCALSEMHNKMMLCGYPEYEDFCRSFIDKIDRAAKSLRKKRCMTNEIHPVEEAEQARPKSVS